MSQPLLPPPSPLDISRRDSGTRWVSYITVGTLSAAVITGGLLVAGMQSAPSDATANQAADQVNSNQGLTDLGVPDQGGQNQDDSGGISGLVPPDSAPQSQPQFQIPDQQAPQYQDPGQFAPQSRQGGNGPASSGS